MRLMTLNKIKRNALIASTIGALLLSAQAYGAVNDYGGETEVLSTGGKL